MVVLYGALSDSVLAARRAAVLGRTRLMYADRPPLHIVEAHGVWMVDAAGRRYLDAYNNVPVVGHGHPRVVEAIAEQTARLTTNTRYLHEAIVAAAEELLARFPAGFDRVFFVNSGSEANDLAWRIACATTEGSGALVTDNDYFGLSTAVSAFSPALWAKGEQPPPHVAVTRPPGRQHGGLDSDARLRALYLEEAADRVARLNEAGIKLAATVIDHLYTSDGILRVPEGYATGLAELVRSRGGVVIADEIQGGFARTGSSFWSFSGQEVVPDIVTLGKPMGNGYPVAAVVTRAELLDPFLATRTVFSTFGGNPVAAVAALTVLRVIEDEGLQENARATGAYLTTQLVEHVGRHPLVHDVRGTGLMVGVELRHPDTNTPATEQTARLCNDLVERGVLVGSTGKEKNVLKIRPPLTFSREHVDQVVDALDQVLQEQCP